MEYSDLDTRGEGLINITPYVYMDIYVLLYFSRVTGIFWWIIHCWDNIIQLK